MKLNQLSKVIKQEVKQAVKEELQEMLNEAVKVASEPDTAQQDQSIKEQQQIAAPKQTNLYQTGDPINDLLQETKATMSQQDRKNIDSNAGQQVTKPNFAQTKADQMNMTGGEPGLDLNQLDFAKNAAKIYQKSLEKDKNKNQA